MLLGTAAVRRLMRARVVVVGLGAVGSYAVEALARSAVGHLRLVDCDVIRESNVNRQLYALSSTLGRPKAEVARERVLDINPDCDVEALQTFADARTAPCFLADRPDVVIDAIDSLGPKIELIATVVRAGLYLVSSMGAATRTDPWAVRVGDLSETRACPLARFVRKWLRKKGIVSGVRCVYSVEPSDLKAPGGKAEGMGKEDPLDTETPETAEFHTRGRARAPLGSVSYLTGIFGLVAAREAVAHILDQHSGESGSAGSPS